MKNNFLNWFFAVEVIFFGLIITGVLPRETALYLGVALVIYFFVAPLDDSIVLFVRSIPLFLALPLTETFDNFNVWRILAGIIFLKWLWQENQKSNIKNQNDNEKLRGNHVALRNSKFKNLFQPFVPKTIASSLLYGLLILAILSIIPAGDNVAAVKRIIFFLNFAVLGVVIYDKANQDTDRSFAVRLIRNSVIPVIIVAIVGYIQVISTYFVDIYQFMRIWGEGIQCRQFGEQWCNIAVQVGNTWFAYFGDQLSLRVFSLFPDSHSFPQFVLLGIPAVLVMVWQRRIANKKLAGLLVCWLAIALLFLIIILSGTRGIWVASIGVLLLSFATMFWMRKTGVEKSDRTLFKGLTAYIIIFFLAFSVAFPIFSSPQFLLSNDGGLLRGRLRSIIDFGELSNAQRIEIWKKTAFSIKEKPLLGVGIGNYPVVLGQDIRLAKAGSSAHNIYLHVAAEMGILAGIIFIWFLWLLFKKNYDLFIKENHGALKIYLSAMLLYMPWILIYSLTDIAILDERILLFVIIHATIILGLKKQS